MHVVACLREPGGEAGEQTFDIVQQFLGQQGDLRDVTREARECPAEVRGKA